MKSFHTCLITLMFVLATSLQAQTVNTHALEQAKADAQKFKLNDKDLKQFRKHRVAYMQRLNVLGDRGPFSAPLNPFSKNSAASPLAMPSIRDGYNHVDYTSDYFKPTNATTADTTLLRDSVYVKAFREAAYQSTTARRTAGHYIALYGGITVAVALIVGFVVLVNALGDG